MTLEFDSKTHTYRCDGAVIPSVTQILESGGLVNTRFFTEESADRGKWIHSACEAMDNGTLDWLNVPLDLVPYLEAYALFLKQSGFVPELIEEKLFSRDLWFCGTLDRAGQMNGKHFVIDIKSGAASSWHSLQTAGYAILMSEAGAEPSRAALYLNKNGKYKLVTHTKTTDFGDFITLVKQHNEKEHHE